MWLQGAALAAVIAILVAASPVALVVPFVLLALGVLDARLAAAATVFWLWRLATADLGDVLAALGDASLTLQVVRWLAMLLGLALRRARDARLDPARRRALGRVRADQHLAARRVASRRAARW